MRICVVGSGYVGLVTAACLAEAGNHVVGVDNDADKVATLAAGECPLYEPGVAELLRSNLGAGRLTFTTDLQPAVAAARVIFIAVGTPSRADGSADTSAVEAVAVELARSLTDGAVVVTKSTVPVGTGDILEDVIGSRTGAKFHVVSNPEFLKEGTAVKDFMIPDRVIVGANNEEAGRIVAELYRPFVRPDCPVMIMSRAAAEMAKYAANAYLATRISFINEIASTCERLGVNVDEVRHGIGADARIGNHFLYPGIGYGGSCFPKDVQALAATAKRAGARCEILEAVHQRNLQQRESLARRIIQRFGGNLRDRRLAVWGLAFKPNTDDIREAPAIAIVESLLASGAAVSVHDPRARDNARTHLGNRVEYCDDAYESLEGADALLVLTEWMEYSNPDFDRIREALNQPLVFDGRNVYSPKSMARFGFEYHSIGRPLVESDPTIVSRNASFVSTGSARNSDHSNLVASTNRRRRTG